jgi:hypothetical protein
MKVLGSRLTDLWCRLMHPSPMWPVNGHYRCSVCLRSYPVPWEKRPVGTKAPVVVLPIRTNEAPVRASKPAARIAVAASR